MPMLNMPVLNMPVLNRVAAIPLRPLLTDLLKQSLTGPQAALAFGTEPPYDAPADGTVKTKPFDSGIASAP